MKPPSLLLSPLLLLALPAQAITPTDGYVARQSDYMDYCAAGNGPGMGNVYGQLCVLAAGRSDVNRDAFSRALDEINLREDTADFELNAILRMMLLYKDSPQMPQDLQGEIEDAILNFKYWLDEPGPDTMCWWSENHQILFGAAELMAGTLYPDRVFTNSGLTGEELVAHAEPRILEWIERRGRFGFSEWHSTVYFNEDIPALVNLADFAENRDLATRASMALDIIAFDFANNYFDGTYATAMGRVYESKLVNGNQDSVRESAWLMLGLGQYRSTGNFAASHLASSLYYAPPPVLEAIAEDARLSHVNRQRDGIDIKDGPDYGIGYSDYDDIMFYWGMGAYAASRVVYGTFQAVDHYDLWEDFFWGTVPFLEPLVGMKAVPIASQALDEITRGSALESMSLYTWRTPHYQLSGAQNFHMGFFGAQQHMWRASLDGTTWVFTTAPGGSEDDYAAGAWTGGWLPQAMLHQNVGLIRYNRDDYLIGDSVYFLDYTHAFFPKDDMDEVVEVGSWVFGRKGESYIGLYSQNPTRWSTEPGTEDYELIADGKNNVWITELGSAAESGTFGDFIAELDDAAISISNSRIEFDSPSQGYMVASVAGSLTVGGLSVDIGPYERWENAYATQPFGTYQTIIEHNGETLTLDFDTGERRYDD